MLGHPPSTFRRPVPQARNCPACRLTAGGAGGESPIDFPGYSMNLDLTEQQTMMRETARRFFEDEAGPAHVRAIEPARFSAKLWRAAADLGFLGVRVPEAKGGLDAGLLDAALLCEEAGRQLSPIPIEDGIAAARLLAAIGADALLEGMDKAPVLLGAHEAGGDDAVLLRRDGDRIVAGETVLAEGAEAVRAFEAATIERGLLRASWLIGAGVRSLELASDYARERSQFGRPIGSFQAIAHPLANSATDLEAARLLLWRAIWSIAQKTDDAAALPAMLTWWTATAARTAVRRALRTFGGYGLSLEYDISLYFAAIQHRALIGGDPELQLAEAGDRLWAGVTPALPDAGDPGIDFGFGAKAEALAARVRAFFDAEMTPELRAKAHHGTDGHDPDFHKKLGAAGLLFPDWPKEFGGEDAGGLEITALGRAFEEYRWGRIPVGITNMGAYMTMKFGSPELKAEVLPRLRSGEALSCLGFTEPESGSDMYAARTRADRDGDDWIINGQKMFTTGAHLADYVLMLARTDPQQTKHRGLTIFLVPMTLPGVDIQPVHTMQDERTNITFYDNVRIPDRYRLGEVDGGLQVMAAAMSIEHGGEGYHVFHYSLIDAALNWAKTPGADGAKPIDDRVTRARLAKSATRLALADVMSRRATWAGENGKATRWTGPMAKMFSTEIFVEDGADLVALTAPASLLHATPALAEIEEKQRQAIGQTIYGGTSEVHRGIIAEQALGLPRAS
ncbi:acyl-CoA dehydrogenase [Sphingomonas crocodyli]|uniref:Acyl-CoA dehydrogenase n=2 Tax=Sphingomonas crocodyli TaxID=1979270 RepID=A0A437M6N2_9SPHN|nr:acyl-CoA dehydrogenase [Sphingomonas crocodyli]